MYALESKKRKFDRLLQSINKSQTSLPLAQELETPKKRRVTAPPSLSKRPRLSGVNNGSVISLNRPRPNYLPHSQEAFFERLRTFAPVQKWRVSSTEEINAAEWAKRGWSCVGDDMVACNGGCNEQLLVKLEDSPDDDEADEDPEKTLLDDVEGFSDHEEDDKHKLLVARYKGLITTAHSENCPWRHHGCPPTIHRLPLTNANDSLSTLKKRYTTLLSPSLKLPPAAAIRLTATPTPSTEALTATISLTRTDFDLFPPQPPSTDPPPSSPTTSPQPLWPPSDIPTHHTALTLAATGWEAPPPPTDSSTSGTNTPTMSISHCTSCFRRLGLWLYTSGTLSHLDAIDEHLEYCPWRSPTAQASDSAGWEILGRTMEREVRRKRAKPGGGTANMSVDGATEGADSGDGDGENGETLSLRGRGRDGDGEESIEDREKKMKALMRRIRELKKPFNVKGLLKKNKV